MPCSFKIYLTTLPVDPN